MCAALSGRGITPYDGQYAAAPVFVMNYKMWQREFEGDPKLRGTLVIMTTTMLVGIMPVGSTFTTSDLVARSQTKMAPCRP